MQETTPRGTRPHTSTRWAHKHARAHARTTCVHTLAYAHEQILVRANYHTHTKALTHIRTCTNAHTYAKTFKPPTWLNLLRLYSVIKCCKHCHEFQPPLSLLHLCKHIPGSADWALCRLQCVRECTCWLSCTRFLPLPAWPRWRAMVQGRIFFVTNIKYLAKKPSGILGFSQTLFFQFFQEKTNTFNG